MGSFPFSTDSAAWNSTKGTVNCDAEKAPPLTDFRWGLASRAGAISWWHIDSNGFGSYIDTKAGSKWWIVARRKGSDHSFESFSEVENFFDGLHQVDRPNLEHFELEAVILPPRTRL
jgi:hypothetical protein